MKNSIGNQITVTLFGESHGEAIGAVIDGLAPGIKIDNDYISSKMEARKPFGKISTTRHEPDNVRFISGIFEGYTTGTPIAIVIENTNTKSQDYSKLKSIPRPSHADYTAECKYHGFQDYRGGGHFSGRITAALVAAGAVISYALLSHGIYIGTRIKRIAGIEDESEFKSVEDILCVNNRTFATLDDTVAPVMAKKIEEAAQLGDSVGGVLETLVLGVPAGIGEPWFDTVEGVLSHLVFSVPAVKGVEFGGGFAIADALGSVANDAFTTDGEKITTLTNNSGGIQGGITNGMPIIFRCAIKPTPSIFTEQDSVDFEKMQNVKLQINGRHDPAIVHRIRAVIDAVTAIGIADLIATKYGTDFLSGGARK